MIVFGFGFVVLMLVWFSSFGCGCLGFCRFRCLGFVFDLWFGFVELMKFVVFLVLLCFDLDVCCFDLFCLMVL